METSVRKIALADLVISLVLAGSLAFAQAEAPAKAPLSGSLGTLRCVPAGSFQRDGKAENVTAVGEFYMAEKEVTWSQFSQVMGTDDIYIADMDALGYGRGNVLTTPCWYLCIACCNKYSMRDNLTPVYSIKGSADPKDWGPVPLRADKAWDAVVEDPKANGYRLPTEAEWEWAAMGATKDPKNAAEGWEKPFAIGVKGGTVDQYAVFVENSYKNIGRGGERRPNDLGLYDMSGNAREWCWDWLGETPSGNVDNAAYRGPATGTERVVKGGGFMSPAADLKLSARSGIAPDGSSFDCGFRVVRSF